MSILILAACPSAPGSDGNVAHGSGMGRWAASIAAALLRPMGRSVPPRCGPLGPLALAPSALRPGQRAA